MDPYEASVMGPNEAKPEDSHIIQHMSISDSYEGIDENSKRNDSAQQPNSNTAPDSYAGSAVPDDLIKLWLRVSLVLDKESSTDALYIFQAFQTKFLTAAAKKRPEIDDLIHVANLVLHDVFPGSTTINPRSDGSECITGVRWKNLVESVCSLAVEWRPFPDAIRAEAHNLLYLPQPDRTIAFLKTYFERGPGLTITLESLWLLYTKAFARSRDTHPIFDEDAFVERLLKTFTGCTHHEVSDGHSVIRGLLVAEKVHGTEKVLTKKRQRDFSRLARAGLIDHPQPRSVFGQKIFDDPLLSLPHTVDGPAPSPMTERLRRRAQNPRHPLGDEEPGFPGVSLKRIQRRMKRNWTLWDKLYQENFVGEGKTQPTAEEWQRAADEAHFSLGSSTAASKKDAE